ncbi:hypothetical protein [Haladaptatus halobius]|uniref:hypothetical protein n=1 Tax=Haladaptatus halobius TaxID=2884875 RepID=UPI001D0A85D0|nr:hypothetical protein [Haladaptatus halobius]
MSNSASHGTTQQHRNANSQQCETEKTHQEVEDRLVSFEERLDQKDEQIEALQQRIETLVQERENTEKELADARDRADRAEAVADAAIAHIRQQWTYSTDALEPRVDNVTKRVFENHEQRLQDIEHDRVDVSDLINSGQIHDLEIQRKTAARLAAEREDAESPLSGNKHRMTFLWREFIESAQKTKGGKLELDSSACRRRLEHRAGIHDPNTNTVQRSMKMLARHTRQDGSVSASGEWDDKDNLVRFEPGEQGEQAARLVADAEEFREFAAEQSRAALEQGGDGAR